MIPGSLRYPRLGDAARPERGMIERALGVDFSGKLVSDGGTGITVGAMPSTILAGILGSIVGASISQRTTLGVTVGFFVGGAIATSLRWAEKVGF